MSTEPAAPDAARIEKNLEAFNNQLRRTSERLAGRGSSGPPPEIDSTSESTPPLLSSNSVIIGRGRGRGQKGNAFSTRAATAARRLAAGEKTNDGTGDNPAQASMAEVTLSNTAEVTVPGTEGASNQSNGTLVAGMITRDDVNVGTTRKLSLKLNYPPYSVAANAMPQPDCVAIGRCCVLKISLD